jgi:hypothetical protein
MVNIVAEVISLPYFDGKNGMDEYMSGLVAEGSLDSAIKTGFILKAIRELEKVPKSSLPDFGKDKFISFELETDPIEGTIYRLNPKAVKALGKQPIYELRLSVERFNWHFRVTFFPKYHPDTRQLFYCLVDPFEKEGIDEGIEDPTDFFKDRAYSVYTEVIRDFNQYREHFVVDDDSN